MAQRIAKKDRQAAIEREQDEREHDRWRDALRTRLDSLTSLLEAFETRSLVPSNFTEQIVGHASFIARLRASSEPLPWTRRHWIEGATIRNEDWDEAGQALGLPPHMNGEAVERAEMVAAINVARVKLFAETISHPQSD
jgi:hypothetical protein